MDTAYVSLEAVPRYGERVAERLTERAGHALVLANDEAQALGANEVRSVHLLLGLLRAEGGLAARVLDSFGVAAEDVRALVAAERESGARPLSGPLPFARDTNEASEHWSREALKLGHNYIGTEHVLLGVLTAPAVGLLLRELEVEPEEVRDKVMALLSGHFVGDVSAQSAEDVAVHVATALGNLREEKERAIEAGEFERAAALRERGAQLVRAIDALQAETTVEPQDDAQLSHRRGVTFAERTRPAAVLVAVLAAVAFALGVLVGVLL